MNHHKLTRLASAALLCALTTGAHAQANTTAAPQQVTITGAPVIEANRSDAFGSLATEVGEAQVRDLNALDLSSALRRTPGVAVSRFNPVGSFGGDEGGSVYVRGLGASRPGSEIKTFVDGIPFYMGVWDHSLLDLLPIGGMSSIAVHKAPQPQHYGNTFAAIELAPRVARRDGLAGNLRLSAGSFGTVVEQADLAGRFGDLEFSAAQGHAESDGHRPAADGTLDNGLVRGSVRLSPNWRVGALLLSADNRVSDPGEEGLPATRTGTYDTRGTLATLSVSHEHGPWRGRLQVYDNSGVGVWNNPTAAVVRSTFHLSGLRWVEEAQPWQGGELLAGVDVDRMAGTVAFNGYTAYDGDTQRLVAPHVALAQQWALGGGWAVQPSAGVRLYQHSVYGHSTAPHAGLVLSQGETLALRANAARGLSYPGLGAPLLNAIVPPLAGAPDSWRSLRPERMDHVELGARWAASRASVLDLALFNDQLKDRYVFAFPPVATPPALVSLGAYRVKGAELSWQQQWSAAWSSFAGLTLLSSSLADLPYAPKRSLALGATWKQGPWRLSADAQAQSSMLTLNRARADGAVNSAGVAGFAVANLRGAYAWPVLGPRGEAFVNLENLLDKRYAYRSAYPMPGRSGQVGLNLSL